MCAMRVSQDEYGLCLYTPAIAQSKAVAFAATALEVHMLAGAGILWGSGLECAICV